MFSLIPNSDVISVERAIAEFRAGRPALIEQDGDAALAIGVEAFDIDLATNLESFAAGRARLVLPSARLRRLGVERTTPGAIALPAIDLSRIERLSLHIDGRIDAPVACATKLDEAAIELAALSYALPALVVVPLTADSAIDPAIVKVDTVSLFGYRRAKLRDLRIVGRAPVPLEGAPDSEFVVFRGGEGLRDQVAIIIGRPDFNQPVPMRLHSACLTGDLFGSLKCDCGDQLRDTAQGMARDGGGVILYLDQEGRGNGIANKMRAYKLQSQGFDTYDADEVLGFEADQRRFDFAAEMLRQLGVAHVRIMTNNPQKIVALQRAGLDVVSDQRVLGRPTVENVRYLASKRDRAGHIIDFDALAARARPKE
ncbi:GTP cyclohydrolase II RibA [Terrarubrum flagellatum]|uniref:GTP cyclohydrolase II RibA n=1 Tax=Terrirubrum flagellatum TaxID=2895980 RepID=UPI003144F718